MVYGLAIQHKGFTDLRSEEGTGTTVLLYFPAVVGAARAPAGATAEDAPVGGSERILVVDDEEGIRRSAVRVLTRFGYHVEEAPDGQAAMAVLSSAGVPFHLVLTDVVIRAWEAWRCTRSSGGRTAQSASCS